MEGRAFIEKYESYVVFLLFGDISLGKVNKWSINNALRASINMTLYLLAYNF